MSHKVFVISDLHFGHKNMALHRGFSSVEEHDSYIINNWNKVVNKRDTVWILGDLTMERSHNYELLNQLKGIKNVVLGNHDMPQHVPELLKYVNKVCGCFDYKRYILTHVPIHMSEASRHLVNIHGHLHEHSIQNSPKHINVSCEVINYTPVLLESILNGSHNL